MEQGGANGGARRRTGGVRNFPDQGHIRRLFQFGIAFSIITNLALLFGDEFEFLIGSPYDELGFLGRMTYYVIMMVFVFPVVESASSRYGLWLPATWAAVMSVIHVSRWAN